jgi:dolichol-phosphate mannosyltransferase
MNLSLVIPTLNEEEGIEKLLHLVSKAISSSSQVTEAEIIVVDDGSKDKTVAIASSQQIPQQIKIIQRNVRGLATAVLTGFKKAKYEILGVMDADLSHPPEMIKELIGALEGNDLVLGSRNMPGGLVEKWPWYRKLSSQFAALLTRLLGVKVTDPMSGFFFLKRNSGEVCPFKNKRDSIRFSKSYHWQK